MSLVLLPGEVEPRAERGGDTSPTRETSSCRISKSGQARAAQGAPNSVRSMGKVPLLCLSQARTWKPGLHRHTHCTPTQPSPSRLIPYLQKPTICEYDKNEKICSKRALSTSGGLWCACTGGHIYTDTASSGIFNNLHVLSNREIRKSKIHREGVFSNPKSHQGRGFSRTVTSSPTDTQP